MHSDRLRVGEGGITLILPAVPWYQTDTLKKRNTIVARPTITVIYESSIKKFVILRVKYVIPYYCIYRNVIPQNLNSLLRLVVAKWTFAVWFHAEFRGISIMLLN